MYGDPPKSGIRKFYLDAHGRFSRETFVVAWLGLSLFPIIFAVPLIYLVLPVLGLLVTVPIIIIFSLSITYSYFVIGIKRLHDLNLTGWYSFFLIFHPFLFIYLVFAKGKPVNNNYGSPLDYTGPSFILKASYVFAVLSFLCFFIAVANYIPNRGKEKQMKNMSPRNLQKKVKSPTSMGFLFIDNQLIGVGTVIAKDRILVMGTKGKQMIQKNIELNKKVEIRFSDSSSAKITRLLTSNDSFQMFVFLVDSPIGVPIEVGEDQKKLLDEMNAFQ